MLGAPPVRRGTLDIGAIELAGSPPPLGGVDFPIAPRRTVLDTFLVNAAREAGAEIREGFHVTGLLTENDRVVGIRGTSEERARIVIGADGAHSLIAHAVKASRYNEQASTASAWYAYWEGGPEGRSLRKTTSGRKSLVRHCRRTTA